MIPILLFVVCLVTYGHVLTHPFMFDDFGFFNADMVPACYPHFGSFFTRVYDQHYAPIFNIINVSLFHLFRTPLPIYLINLALFYSNCVLLFYFLWQVSKNLSFALLTSIFFSVHPMSGDIVQHITLNNILLETSLMLLGLMAFYQHLKLNNKYLFIASNICFVLALLCNEISLVFIFYALAVSFILIKRGLKDSLKACASFFLLGFLFLIIWFVMTRPVNLVNGRFFSKHMSFWDYGANFFRMIIWYIGNLFVPRSIVFMYSIEPIAHFIWLWNLLFVVFLSGLLTVLFYLKRTLESFALVLFFTGFLVTIPIFVIRYKMVFNFEPYWMYFPSVGFFLFIALMLLKLKKHVHPWAWMGLLPVLLLFYFIQTQKLNLIASTQLSYFENWLHQAPQNDIAATVLSGEYVYNNYKIPQEFFTPMVKQADRYLSDRDYKTASQLLLKLSYLKMPNDQRQILLGKLAFAYDKGGFAGKSRDLIRSFLHSSSDYLQLSYTFYQSGINDIALFILRECRAVYPQCKEAYLLGGMMLANERHYSEAILLWKQGLALDPTDQRFGKAINITNAMALGNK